MTFAVIGSRRRNGMTLKQAIELVAIWLPKMKNGEFRLYVKNGEITHVNKTEELFPKRDQTKF